MDRLAATAEDNELYCMEKTKTRFRSSKTESVFWFYDRFNSLSEGLNINVIA